MSSHRISSGLEKQGSISSLSGLNSVYCCAKKLRPRGSHPLSLSNEATQVGEVRGANPRTDAPKEHGDPQGSKTANYLLEIRGSAILQALEEL